MTRSSLLWNVFVKEVVQHGVVWAIRDKDGFPTSTNINGNSAMPFWSTRTRAKTIIDSVPAYKHFTPYEIAIDDFIEKWLIGLQRDGLLVGVNWGGNSRL